MSELSPTARVVLSILQTCDTPITLRDLTGSLGPYATRRDVEAACAELALAGWPLVSETRQPRPGMRLVSDPAEVRAAADRLSRRIAHQYLRVRALRRTAARMAQPATLWEVSM